MIKLQLKELDDQVITSKLEKSSVGTDCMFFIGLPR